MEINSAANTTPIAHVETEGVSQPQQQSNPIGNMVSQFIGGSEGGGGGFDVMSMLGSVFGGTQGGGGFNLGSIIGAIFAGPIGQLLGGLSGGQSGGGAMQFPAAPTTPLFQDSEGSLNAHREGVASTPQEGAHDDTGTAVGEGGPVDYGSLSDRVDGNHNALRGMAGMGISALIGEAVASESANGDAKAEAEKAAPFINTLLSIFAPTPGAFSPSKQTGAKK